jgi:hypothetical protein
MGCDWRALLRVSGVIGAHHLQFRSQPCLLLYAGKRCDKSLKDILKSVGDNPSHSPNEADRLCNELVMDLGNRLASYTRLLFLRHGIQNYKYWVRSNHVGKSISKLLRHLRQYINIQWRTSPLPPPTRIPTEQSHSTPRPQTNKSPC